MNIICPGSGVIILQPWLDIDYAKYLDQGLAVSALDNLAPSKL